MRLRRSPICPWREEAFDGVTSEVGQRGLVKVGLDERALCQKDLLNRAQEADLLGIVVVRLNVLLEAPLHHLRVIGDGVEGKQVAEEGEESCQPASRRRSGYSGWTAGCRHARVRCGACVPGRSS